MNPKLRALREVVGQSATLPQHPHEDYGRQVLEMYDSLNIAAHQSGRVPFTIEELRSLSAEQLILHLASNDIRFVFRRPQ